MREQAFAFVDSLPRTDLPACVCVYDESWHQGIVGLVAARVKERCHRPVIAFAREQDGLLKGVRTFRQRRTCARSPRGRCECASGPDRQVRWTRDGGRTDDCRGKIRGLRPHRCRTARCPLSRRGFFGRNRHGWSASVGVPESQVCSFASERRSLGLRISRAIVERGFRCPRAAHGRRKASQDACAAFGPEDRRSTQSRSTRPGPPIVASFSSHTGWMSMSSGASKARSSSSNKLPHCSPRDPSNSVRSRVFRTTPGPPNRHGNESDQTDHSRSH